MSLHFATTDSELNDNPKFHCVSLHLSGGRNVDCFIQTSFQLEIRKAYDLSIEGCRP